MAEYDNTNRGMMSRNTRKTKDTHPDQTGTLNVEGVEYYIDAWVRERKDKSGKFFSFSVKRKDGKAAAAPKPANESRPVTVGPFDDIDDDIPF